jgi:hypothetical protein
MKALKETLDEITAGYVGWIGAPVLVRLRMNADTSCERLAPPAGRFIDTPRKNHYDRF